MQQSLKILQIKKPKAFFLENVRNLLKHDNGKTFHIIKTTLKNLGYSFYYKIIKASDYGLPQHRPRLFMVGFKDEANINGNFYFPEKTSLKYTMSNIFNGKCNKNIGFTLRVGGRGSKIEDRRNWEFYKVNNEIKRITSREGGLMQGFPEDFEFPVSEIQAMKQLGNSVAISAVEEVAKKIVEHMKYFKA
jgi:DNA (cytosine-5)-methyltransferase 1